MPTGNRTSQIGVIIENTLKESLKKYAEKNNWSISRAAAVLIREGLRNHDFLESIVRSEESKPTTENVLPNLNQKLIEHLPRLVGTIKPQRVVAIARGEELTPEEIGILMVIMTEEAEG